MAVNEKGTCCTTNKCTCTLFVLVVASIAVVICVTFLAPSVRAPHPPEELSWWQKTIIYQIYPRSFQDSDGDGTGDLKGIISRLYYFNTINVSAIWLSPFYQSPMRDFGYDVTNYTAVDSLFGTMADFDRLVEEAHRKGIKVIIDFVPNHTSNESSWFDKSRRAPLGDPMRDFYVWNPGKMVNGQKQPPNNWNSVFEGSAWEWDPVRNEYYYHAFLTSQPDLNLRNERVLQELDNVLRFWLNKGVDGVRIDAIPHFYEMEDVTKDEPRGENNGFSESIHPFTKNQPEVFSVVKRWRTIMDEYKKKDGIERFILAETTGISKEVRAQYYEAGSVPFFFNLIPSQLCNGNASCYKQIIEDGLNIPEGKWPNFVIGNHDNRRIADRMGRNYVNAMNMLLLTLPGTPTTYYGEELGMKGGDYTGMPSKDPYAITSNNPNNSRDSERNPMQWNNSGNAGFSNCTVKDCTWLPITPNTEYTLVNVQTESNDGTSSLSIYKYLAQLRDSPAFRSLNIELNAYNGILLYKRWSKKEEYVVALNFGSTRQSVALPGDTGRIVVATTATKMNNPQIHLNNVQLEAGEGLIIEL